MDCELQTCADQRIFGALVSIIHHDAGDLCDVNGGDATTDTYQKQASGVLGAGHGFPVFCFYGCGQSFVRGSLDHRYRWRCIAQRWLGETLCGNQ